MKLTRRSLAFDGPIPGRSQPALNRRLDLVSQGCRPESMNVVSSIVAFRDRWCTRGDKALCKIARQNRSVHWCGKYSGISGVSCPAHCGVQTRQWTKIASQTVRDHRLAHIIKPRASWSVDRDRSSALKFNQSDQMIDQSFASKRCESLVRAKPSRLPPRQDYARQVRKCVAIMRRHFWLRFFQFQRPIR